MREALMPKKMVPEGDHPGREEMCAGRHLLTSFLGTLLRQIKGVSGKC
jgi:hypothetical protein